MIVYADVLIFFNSIIDYFLIGISSVILRIKLKTYRQILSSLVGGLSSLYIFFDNNFFVLDILYRVITTITIILIAFGYNRFTYFIKATMIYFASSLLLFGFVYFTYKTFNISKVIINNTYFYFNFSPLLAIFLTLIIYCVIKMVRRFSNKTLISKECNIELFIDKNNVFAKAYIDTGSLAKDYLSDSELCFVNQNLFFRFTGCNSFSEILEHPFYKNRYRAIPITTLNETSLLEGIRCDNGKIIVKNNIYYLYKPIIILSKNLPNNFEALISAKALDKTPDKILKGDTVETL